MDGFAQKARHSANGARYKSQGQARSASPLVTNQNSDPALKGRNTVRISAFQAQTFRFCTYQGRRAPLRFALAPGFYISRRWRSLRLLRQSKVVVMKFISVNS